MEGNKLEITVEKSSNTSVFGSVALAAVRNACYCTVGLMAGAAMEGVFGETQPGIHNVGALVTGLSFGVNEGGRVGNRQEGIAKTIGYGSLAGALSGSSAVVGYVAGASLVRCMRNSCFGV